MTSRSKTLTKKNLYDYGVRSVDEDGVITTANRDLKYTVHINAQGKICVYIALYDKIRRRSKSLSASRVVWAWHHGSIDEGEYVHHKDGDPFNKSISNLYVTNSRK